VGRKQGITEQQLLDLADFDASPAFSEVEKLVLRYTVAMTETPVEVPDELFAALRQHFDPRQMVELTSAIAWENYRARFDHAFAIEPAGFSEGAVCPVAVGGHHSVES
jgi:alkylhydroperoxidase family enzyme